MLRKTEAYQILLRAKLLSDAAAWFDALEDTMLHDMILTMIQDDQLTDQGVDGTGNVIGYYSFLTSLINPEKVFNTPFTLNDTGQFYQSMLVDVVADGILVKADTEKMDDQEWWSDNILSLTSENMRIFRAEIRDRYLMYARKILYNS